MTDDTFSPEDEAAFEAALGSRGSRVSQEEHEQFVLDNLLTTFRSWQESSDSIDIWRDTERKYRSALEAVASISAAPSGRVVERFCHLPAHDTHNSRGLGLFVSALVNRYLGREQLTVSPRRWAFDDDLGAYLERATMVIQGDVDYRVGYGLQGGEVIVKGAANSQFGDFMQDGELIIEGMVGGDGLNNVTGGHGVIRGIKEGAHFMKGLGADQKGGLLEILCDAPSALDMYLGYGQSGGTLKIVGKVGCQLGTSKSGGKTLVEGVVQGWQSLIGWHMSGGSIHIRGDLLPFESQGATYRPTVGFMQRGGAIRVVGNVNGSIACDTSHGAIIEIIGNVVGDVGRYDTWRTNVTIEGNVKGNIGVGVIRNDEERGFRCSVHGNVCGNIGDGIITVDHSVHGDISLSCDSSRVVVHGDVDGTVGEGMQGGEVHVDGRISRIGDSFGGRVLQRRKDVTRISLRNRVIRYLGDKLDKL